jgi:predicted dehydrogenase
MHVNAVVKAFSEMEQTIWVGCADTVPSVPDNSTAPYTRLWNREHIVAGFGLPWFDDWRALLAEERPDLVIVTCENARHADVVEACASVGAMACVEKPMAASLGDGLRMARATRIAGSALMINWPILWSPLIRTAVAALHDGVIGRVLQVRHRAGHSGPFGPGVRHPGVDEEAAPLSHAELAATWWYRGSEGGGAMIDYCCYGAMLSRWIVGGPAVAAMGMRANLASPWADCDDNGFLMVRFPEAVSVLEGSWTTGAHGVNPGPVVYGSDGTLVVDREANLVRLLSAGGEEHLPARPLPEGRASIAEEIVHHLTTAEPLHPVLVTAMNLDALAILDAGRRSAESAKLEVVEPVGPPNETRA